MRRASMVKTTSRAKTGLDAPALTVVAKFDEGKKAHFAAEKIFFVSLEKDADEAAHEDVGVPRDDPETPAIRVRVPVQRVVVAQPLHGGVRHAGGVDVGHVGARMIVDQHAAHERLLHEKLTPRRWAGVVAVVLGVIALKAA